MRVIEILLVQLFSCNIARKEDIFRSGNVFVLQLLRKLELPQRVPFIHKTRNFNFYANPHLACNFMNLM